MEAKVSNIFLRIWNRQKTSWSTHDSWARF